MSSGANFYTILGVPRTADDATLKRSFHELAMKWHPDKNPGNVAAAEAKFKEISEAYATLRDPDKRAKYDRTLDDGARPPPQSRPSASASSGFSSFYGARFTADSSDDDDDEDLGSAFSGMSFEELLAFLRGYGGLGGMGARRTGGMGFGRTSGMGSARTGGMGFGRPGTSGPRRIDPLSVHIVQLSPRADEFSIRDAFSKYGRVIDIHIMRERFSQESMCKGFVKFATVEACQAAIRAGQTIIGGHVVKILQAYAKR
jgi:curved DNA-binding protein CbpA